MKKIILITFLLLVLSSCSNSSDGYINKINITTNYTITRVSIGKYTKVIGYINNGGFKYTVTNGNTGYYYKKYSLKEGDIIKINIDLYQYRYNTNNPYKDDSLITTSDVDLSLYEIRN